MNNKIGSGRDIDSAIERRHRLGAGETVTPGELLEIQETDDDGVPIVGSQTSTGNVAVRIAREKATGSTTPRESPVDVNYTNENDEVRAYVLRPGERDKNGIAAAAIAEGEYLVSNGDGRFAPHDAEAEGAKIAVAIEAAAAADDRFEYEVI